MPEKYSLVEVSMANLKGVAHGHTSRKEKETTEKSFLKSRALKELKTVIDLRELIKSNSILKTPFPEALVNTNIQFHYSSKEVWVISRVTKNMLNHRHH